MRQRSMACGQRVENTQPAGGLSGEGNSPVSTMRSAAVGRREAGRRGQQRLRVGVQRAREDALLAALLHGQAEVHHQHVVRDVPDDAEIVRNEEVREAEVALQVGKQVQHLRLDRDVERRDRLVGHDQRRIQHQRPRNRDALALAAGEHVRIADVVLGPQADLRQHRPRARGALGRSRDRC